MTPNQVEQLLDAIRSIVNGGVVPSGFEALTMSLGGKGNPGDDSVAYGMHDVADSIRELAEAIKNKEA